MWNEMIEFLKQPPIVAVIIQIIWLFIITKIFAASNRRILLGAELQGAELKEILTALVNLKIDLNSIFEEEKRKEFITQEQLKIQKSILTLKFIGSKKMRLWINNKISSSFSKELIWLTPENQEELIYLLQLELKIIGIISRLKHWFSTKLREI